MRPYLFLVLSSIPWVSGAQTPESSSSALGAAWLGLVTLTLLVVLFAVVLWLYRRGQQAGNATGSIRVLASQALGPRERVVVVRIDDRILALGHTPTHISLLTELESFDESAAPPALVPKFSSQLQQWISARR